MASAHEARHGTHGTGPAIPTCASWMRPRRRFYGILAMLSVLCTTQRMLPFYYGLPESLSVNPLMLLAERGEAQSSGAYPAIAGSNDIIGHPVNGQKASPSSSVPDDASTRRSTTAARLQALKSILYQARQDRTHRGMQNNPRDGLASILSALRPAQKPTGTRGPDKDDQGRALGPKKEGDNPLFGAKKDGKNPVAVPPVAEAPAGDELPTTAHGSQPSADSPPQPQADEVATAAQEAPSEPASEAAAGSVGDSLRALRGPRTVPAPASTSPHKQLPPPIGGKCKHPAPALRSCMDDFLDAPLTLNASRATRGVITMSSGGQFGNYAFLIAMSAILSERVGYDVRVQEAFDYFPWTLGKDSTPIDHCTHWTYMNDKNFCDTLRTLPQAVQAEGHCIELQDAYLQRFSLFATSMPLVRKVLASPGAASLDVPGEEDLVIHIRFLGPSHKYYGDADMVSPQDVAKADFYAQLDAEYYDKIITSRTYTKVWVVCDPETQEAALVQHLQSKHNVHMHSSRNWWDDYSFLCNAKRIVLPISTFSWWAALLNDAVEIHYPLAALWHPSNPHHLETFQSQLPGSLTVYGPGDDERYVYHDLKDRRWFGRYDSCTDTFTYAEGGERDEQVGQEQAPVSAKQRLRRRV